MTARVTAAAAPPEAVDELRLFIALWPDGPAARERAARHAEWRRCAAWPPGTAFVPPARLHLTLHFVGALPRTRLAALHEALGEVASPAFDLCWGVRASWPRGLAVLLPRAVPVALADLHREVGTALQRAGLPLEKRAFAPHLTFARRATRAAGWDAQEHAPSRDDWCWPVERFTLVQSLSQSRGGYQVLQAYPLGPPDRPGPA